MSIINKIIQARSDMILDDPFFGQLACGLSLVEDPTCPTFWTDGRSMGFNPAFAAQLTLENIIAINKHEVLHVANEHPWRREGREKMKWNEACDYAINPIILSDGGKLPQGCLYERSYEGMSAELIYSQLKDEEGGEGGEGGEPGDKHDWDIGEVRECPGTDSEIVKEEWKVKVVQAAQAARAVGKLPAGLEKLIESIENPKIDYRSALRKYIQERSKTDYSYRRPNRKYLPSGLYLPELNSEQLGEVVLLLDASGSRDYAEARAECASETMGIIEEAKPRKTYICSFDTEIYPLAEIEAGDFPSLPSLKGGGGTTFSNFSDWIEQQGIDPACVICVTDGYGDWERTPPSYPIVWLMTTEVTAPYGETLRI